jgi:hypothetical protein
MNALRTIVTVIGIGCLGLGVLAVLSGGGTTEQVAVLGQSLVIAGAILLAGALISAAIAGNNRNM